jgi:hypothetical protein
MPIHPAVLAHFGIEVPAADYLYPVLDEGYFSFEAYCRRYWNFEFNRLLHSAIAKADTNPSEAIPELRLALERSPDSRAGQRALKDAERAVSDVSMLTPLVLAAPPAPVAAAPVTAPVLAPPGPAPAFPATFATPPADAAPPAPAPFVAAGIAAADPLAAAAEPKSAEAANGETPAQAAPVSPAATGGIIPRSAFGSALVRVPPSLPPETPDDADIEPALPGLRFTKLPEKVEEPEAFSAGELVPLTEFPETQRLTPLVQLPPDDEPEPEPQPYVELTQFGDPPALPAPSNNLAVRGRGFTPLPPAEHLIPLLPRMLPNSRGMAGAVDKPFAEMPETMPPPPLRPVLPPELHPETVKVSLMTRIIDQLRK